MVSPHYCTSQTPTSYRSKEGVAYLLNRCLNFNGTYIVSVINTVKINATKEEYVLVNVKQESSHLLKTVLRVVFYSTVIFPIIAAITVKILTYPKKQYFYSWQMNASGRIYLLYLTIIQADARKLQHLLQLVHPYSNHLLNQIPPDIRSFIKNQKVRAVIYNVDRNFFNSKGPQNNPGKSNGGYFPSGSSNSAVPKTHIDYLKTIYDCKDTDPIPSPKSQHEIRRKFRARTLIIHPDKHPQEEKDVWGKKLTELNLAFQSLQDTDFFKRLPTN